MKNYLAALGLLSLAVPLLGQPAVLERPDGETGDLRVERKQIEIEDGTVEEVESGTLLVPENRAAGSAAPISIPFYRLRSTAERPASPIFILAGGPGSSWIDRFENEENFAEVKFYQGLADVVLFDQRGAGHSMPELHCDGLRRSLPFDEPLDRSEIRKQMVEMSRECRDRWIEAGVDLASYNTVENAADVLALQSALGYESMTLVGGSYGSHLALALMRIAPQKIDRVVLYGVEGLDHTWDDPSGRLATLERIAGAAEADPKLGPSIPEPGLLAALETVLERLEKEPAVVSVGEGDESIEVVVDSELIRWVAGMQAGRRSRPNVWPEFLLDLLEGDYSFAARGAVALRRLRIDDPMHYMMDCSSGISAERAERYRNSPAKEILGDINFEYESLCATWRAADLGADFRAPLVSDIPALIVHGTWDMSTPIENAREVVAGLSNGHLIEVIGGNHGALYNLYSHWEPAYEKLGAFLRGEATRLPSSVTMAPMAFEPRSEPAGN